MAARARRPTRPAAVPDQSRQSAQPRRDRAPGQQAREHASHSSPTLHNKTISPHVLRHTAAMNLLHAGVDSTVIALWLGHESVEATQIYLHADMAIKEQALARTHPT